MTMPGDVRQPFYPAADLWEWFQRWIAPQNFTRQAAWKAKPQLSQAGSPGTMSSQGGIRGGIQVGSPQQDWTLSNNQGESLPPNPPPPPTEPDKPITYTSGGRTFQLITDINGKSQWIDLGSAGTDQQAQLDYYRERDIAERSQRNMELASAEQTRQNEALQQERNRQAIQESTRATAEAAAVQRNFENTPGGKWLAARVKYDDFENMRSQLLGQLTDSRDWITKWQVANKPNPYFSVMHGMANVGTPPQPVAQNMPIPQQLGNWVPQLKGQTSLNPWGPENPADRPQVEIPSGQQMASALPSELGMVSGYADWAGQTWSDIVSQGKAMLPNNPSRGQRWTPRRQ